MTDGTVLHGLSFMDCPLNERLARSPDRATVPWCGQETATNLLPDRSGLLTRAAGRRGQETTANIR